MCVYTTHSCKWCVTTWGCVCVVVCTCEPVLGQDRWALEVRLSLPDLVEEWSVKLGLQLLVAVSLHDLCYFLFPPHVGGVVQVTLQTFSPAHVDDSLADEESWERGKNTRVQQLERVKRVKLDLQMWRNLIQSLKSVVCINMSMENCWQRHYFSFKSKRVWCRRAALFHKRTILQPFSVYLMLILPICLKAFDIVEEMWITSLKICLLLE